MLQKARKNDSAAWRSIVQRYEKDKKENVAPNHLEMQFSCKLLPPKLLKSDEEKKDEDSSVPICISSSESSVRTFQEKINILQSHLSEDFIKAISSFDTQENVETTKTPTKSNKKLLSEKPKSEKQSRSERSTSEKSPEKTDSCCSMEHFEVDEKVCCFDSRFIYDFCLWCDSTIIGHIFSNDEDDYVSDQDGDQDDNASVGSTESSAVSSRASSRAAGSSVASKDGYKQDVNEEDEISQKVEHDEEDHNAQRFLNHSASGRLKKHLEADLDKALTQNDVSQLDNRQSDIPQHYEKDENDEVDENNDSLVTVNLTDDDVDEYSRMVSSVVNNNLEELGDTPTLEVEDIHTKEVEDIYTDEVEDIPTTEVEDIPTDEGEDIPTDEEEDFDALFDGLDDDANPYMLENTDPGNEDCSSDHSSTVNGTITEQDYNANEEVDLNTSPRADNPMTAPIGSTDRVESPWDEFYPLGVNRDKTFASIASHEGINWNPMESDSWFGESNMHDGPGPIPHEPGPIPAVPQDRTCPSPDQSGATPSVDNKEQKGKSLQPPEKQSPTQDQEKGVNPSDPETFFQVDAWEQPGQINPKKSADSESFRIDIMTTDSWGEGTRMFLAEQQSKSSPTSNLNLTQNSIATDDITIDSRGGETGSGVVGPSKENENISQSPPQDLLESSSGSSITGSSFELKKKYVHHSRRSRRTPDSSVKALEKSTQIKKSGSPHFKDLAGNFASWGENEVQEKEVYWSGFSHPSSEKATGTSAENHSLPTVQTEEESNTTINGTSQQETDSISIRILSRFQNDDNFSYNLPPEGSETWLERRMLELEEHSDEGEKKGKQKWGWRKR